MKPKESSLADQSNRLQQLEKALQLREHEIQLLKETADAITGQLHLEILLQMVAERARDLIQAETVLIPVLDRDCEEYTYTAGAGRDAREVVGESLPIEYGVCGWVWRHRKPWWHGVLEELDDEERDRWEREAGTVIMVPLIGKAHLLGGISGLNKIGGGSFDKRDLDLLSMFASQVAVAIDNATAFEELNDAKRRAEAFQEELRQVNQELLKTNKDLEHMALYDSLTGLPNRYLVQDRLERGLCSAERDGGCLTILMVDLNHFKEVNDTLGHHVGDVLLKEVGVRFRQQLREVDTVGRLGGDEFAIILPHTDAEGAASVAGHLHHALETPLELEGGSFRVAASIGAAIYPQHGRDWPTLFRRGDIAMYTAKQGSDRFSVYNPEYDRHSPGRLSLMADLHKALELGQLELFYQPKLDLCSGAIVGVEALMRWHHPEHGMVPPDVFIPILEQSGLLKRHTYWALETAIAQCKAWSDRGWDLGISVNLSMCNLRDRDLPDRVNSYIREYNVHPAALVLEVTESTVMQDPDNVSEVLDNLVAVGIQFSIDDFGTGYSSLSHLKRLSVSELKIDKSFVMEMVVDSDDAVIVRSTVDLAHNMGLRVVAEGVENDDCLVMLREMGCDLVQGFHIAKPMPAAQFDYWLRQSAWRVFQTGDVA